MSPKILAAFATVALVVAACGSGDAVPAESTLPVDPSSTTVAPTTTTAATTTTVPDFPLTLEMMRGTVTLDSRPERIISLSATATESLYAIGAGDQVLAVDESSNFPEDAPVTDLNGFTVTAESIAALEPDLVVMFFDPGDVFDGLRILGIPTMFQTAAVDLRDAYHQIEQLGEATGHAAEATAYVEGMAGEIDSVVSGLPEDAPPAVFYHELDQALYSLTSVTLIGQLYAMLGLENIADAADPDATGYPQLSGEYILEQDPDLIFLADTKCCRQDADTVAGRPGWDTLTAVQSGRVIELDDDVASRWGPRIVDLMIDIRAGIASLEEADA